MTRLGVTESWSMETPIQLENYRLEPNQWAKDMYWFNLPKQMTRFSIPLFVGAALLSILTPEQTPYFAAGAVGIFVMVPLIRYQKLRESIKDPFNKAAWANRQMEFDDFEIRVATSDGTRSQVPIRNFVSCTEYRGYYILYLTRIMMWGIPKTAFRRPEDERVFRETLVSYNLLKPIGKK